MTARDAKFKQAAWAYLIYGVVYWFGGLYLQMRGLGPGRYVAFWFVIGAVIVLLFPYLLSREVRWFDRWVLSRRDFARILTALVLFRALEVGRIALRGGAASMPAIGGGIFPTRIGAWAFFLITLGMAVMLARAAWSRS
ncbi:MAG: hypothetical protein HYS14_09710 [Candidatus Rokubacteria bacterium]|nr:hypothetical protein [Candidatus Rokubacteria bacterium]